MRFGVPFIFYLKLIYLLLAAEALGMLHAYIEYIKGTLGYEFFLYNICNYLFKVSYSKYLLIYLQVKF